MGAGSASQKLIYIGEMEIESEQFEADYAALKEQVSAMGGYLAGETLSGTEPVAYAASRRELFVAELDNAKIEGKTRDVMLKNFDLEKFVSSTKTKNFVFL